MERGGKEEEGRGDGIGETTRDRREKPCSNKTPSISPPHESKAPEIWGERGGGSRRTDGRSDRHLICDFCSRLPAINPNNCIVWIDIGGIFSPRLYIPHVSLFFPLGGIIAPKRDGGGAREREGKNCLSIPLRLRGCGRGGFSFSPFWEIAVVSGEPSISLLPLLYTWRALSDSFPVSHNKTESEFVRWGGGAFGEMVCEQFTFFPLPKNQPESGGLVESAAASKCT